MPDRTSRARTRTAVLDAVRAGTASRADLCRSTGLARSTVTGLVRELLADGLLVEDTGDESAARTPGRPVMRLSLPPRSRVVLAVDFGHSHCQVAVVGVEGSRAEIRAVEVSAVDVDADPAGAIALAERLARGLLAKGGEQPSAGAIGVPAPVDVRRGTVGTGNVLPRWVDRRPAVELQDALAMPFGVDNDANLGALAEATFGAARGRDDLIYVKAATGVGAGLLLGGRLHRGADGRAGEIGHVPVDAGGPLCRCGNRGCLETMASTTQVLSAFAPRADGAVTLDEVHDLVEAGDPGALRVVADAGRLIGRALADLVNNLNPAQVVLGGQLAAAAGAPLLAGVRETVDRFAQPGLARELDIALSGLDAPAELLGAAALAASLEPAPAVSP